MKEKIRRATRRPPIPIRQIHHQNVTNVIDFIKQRYQDRQLTHAATKTAQQTFAKVMEHAK